MAPDNKGDNKGDDTGDKPDLTTGPLTQPGTDLDATDKMPENVPEGDGTGELIGRREGMFGVRGTGDTSGYGGLTRPVEMPGATQPPFGGWMDDVAAALAEATRSAGIEAAVEKVVVHRGEITFHIRREDLVRDGQAAA